MSRSNHLRFALALIGAMSCGIQACAALATDSASDPAYNDGWQVGDNGGSGFGAWSTIGRENGSGSGGGFIAHNHAASQINSGSPGRAFGIFGNGGGVGHAIRPFSMAIAPGHAFRIDMDNQSINTGGTVGFGLQNSSGNNLAEFFFVGGESFYKVNKEGGSTATSIGFTNQGLRLQFILTDADSFSLLIDQLVDGVGTNITTVNGDLIANVNQSISRFRLFNANGGPDVYFNNFSVVAIPEASAFLYGGVVCLVAGLSWCGRRLSGRLFHRAAV